MDNKQKQLALEQKEKYFQYTETKWKLCNENVKLTDLKKKENEIYASIARDKSEHEEELIEGELTEEELALISSNRDINICEQNIKKYKDELVFREELLNEINARIDYEKAKLDFESFANAVCDNKAYFGKVSI